MNAFSVLMGAAHGGGPRQERRQQVAPKPGRCFAGTQMHLDLGQREFAVAACPTCGMLYGKGLPEEDRLHEQFHNAHAAAFKFPGWVSERVVLRDGSRDRLLCVIPGDPKPQMRKVEEVCKRLDTVLGVPQGYLLAPKPPYKVFLWVSGGGRGGGEGGGGGSGGGGGTRSRIIGVLVAQLQRRAHWCVVTPEQPAQRRLSRSDGRHRRAQSHMTGVLPTASIPAVAAAATAAAAGAPMAVTAAARNAEGGGSAAAGGAVVEVDLGPEEVGPDVATCVAGDLPVPCDAGAGAREADAGGAGAATGGGAGDPNVASGETRGTREPREVRHGGDDAHQRSEKRPCLRGTSHESQPEAADVQVGMATFGLQPIGAGDGGARAFTSAGPASAPDERSGKEVGGGGSVGGGSGGEECSRGGNGEVVRVVLGVRGLWVDPGCRRRGVARRLLDAARCCMVPGVAADRTGVAFSSCAAAATAGDEDGGAAFAAFAASYLGGTSRRRSCGGGAAAAAATAGGAARVLLYDDDDDDDRRDGDGA